MKKILTFFLLTVVLVIPQASHAATLSDIMSKLEALQQEIAELRAQITGQATGSIPPGGFATPLKSGSRSDDVAALQEFLTEKGFYSGVADGVFGTATLSALNKYKTSIGFTTFGSSFGS